MATQERDEVTGQETTGHEWDGIKELNTPLPRWWVYVFYATIVWSVGYWVVYPAWPSLSGYTQGVLGYSSRGVLADKMVQAKEGRAVWESRIEQASVEEVAQDGELLNYAIAGGRALFAENCAPCHGSGGAGGAGGPGYPTLADDEWLWGGDLEAIRYTIAHGVRNADIESRQSEMPAFGQLGILDSEQISAVTDYVLALAGRGEGNAQGEQIYQENCAACHGEQGNGLAEIGAPALNNEIWLFGGERAEIIQQIRNPKHGNMPAWTERLGETAVKQLTIYVHSLGGGQ